MAVYELPLAGNPNSNICLLVPVKLLAASSAFLGLKSIQSLNCNLPFIELNVGIFSKSGYESTVKKLPEP